MNKIELINEIVAATDESKNVVGRVVESFMGVVTKGLQDGETVTLPNVGTLSVKQRAARTGRHPVTGAPIQIAAKKVVKFSAGKSLKETVNQ